MSNRIENAFAHGKALITYIMAGDPDTGSTKRYVEGLHRAGADIVELGIPFSDPSADGGTILAADERALKNNYTVDDYFRLVKDIRTTCDVPIVFMSYANVVFKYGIEKFFEGMKAVGADGVILPDVPLEECEEFRAPAARAGIGYIPLAAPTSKERVADIAATANGFLYCVSTCGVTGERTELSIDYDMYKDIKVKKAVGFGIASAKDAVAAVKNFDGVIIGSKIVKFVETGRIEEMFAFVREVKEAISRIQ